MNFFVLKFLAPAIPTIISTHTDIEGITDCEAALSGVNFAVAEALEVPEVEIYTTLWGSCGGGRRALGVST